MMNLASLMSLRQCILDANIEELSKIAIALMNGDGPRFNNQRVFFTHNNTRDLILKYRPEVDWREIEDLLMTASEASA